MIFFLFYLICNKFCLLGFNNYFLLLQNDFNFTLIEINELIYKLEMAIFTVLVVSHN